MYMRVFSAASNTQQTQLLNAGGETAGNVSSCNILNLLLHDLFLVYFSTKFKIVIPMISILGWNHLCNCLRIISQGQWIQRLAILSFPRHWGNIIFCQKNDKKHRHQYIKSMLPTSPQWNSTFVYYFIVYRGRHIKGITIYTATEASLQKMVGFNQQKCIFEYYRKVQTRVFYKMTYFL